MRIKELRCFNKLTQKQVSEFLAVDQTAISQWETGDTMPRADKLPQLARIFHCLIDELYEESEKLG